MLALYNLLPSEHKDLHGLLSNKKQQKHRGSTTSRVPLGMGPLNLKKQNQKTKTSMSYYK